MSFLPEGRLMNFCCNGLKALFGALSKVELNGRGRASLSRAGSFSFPTAWVVSELRETQATGGGAVSAGKDQRCQFDRK